MTRLLRVARTRRGPGGSRPRDVPSTSPRRSASERRGSDERDVVAGSARSVRDRARRPALSRRCWRQTDDPPTVLRGFGDPAALAPGLAVIGARKATPYGLAAARAVRGMGGAAGYTIISGAAIGCDQAAHRAALDARWRHGRGARHAAPTSPTRAEPARFWPRSPERVRGLRARLGAPTGQVDVPRPQPHHRRPRGGAARGGGGLCRAARSSPRTAPWTPAETSSSFPGRSSRPSVAVRIGCCARAPRR